MLFNYLRGAVEKDSLLQEKSDHEYESSFRNSLLLSFGKEVTVSSFHFHHYIDHSAPDLFRVDNGLFHNRLHLVISERKVEILSIQFLCNLHLFLKGIAERLRFHFRDPLQRISGQRILHVCIRKKACPVVKDRCDAKITCSISEYGNIVCMPVLVQKQRIHRQKLAHIYSEVLSFFPLAPQGSLGAPRDPACCI